MGGAVAPPLFFEVTRQQKKQKKRSQLSAFNIFHGVFNTAVEKTFPSFPNTTFFSRLFV